MHEYVKRAGVRQTQEEFIANAKVVHGDRYDYSLVEYVDSKAKVSIICKTHGVFYQAPVKHLAGQNCRKCHPSHVGYEEYLAKFLELNNEHPYNIEIPPKINARVKVKYNCYNCGEVASRRASRIYNEKDKLYCKGCSSIRCIKTKDAYLRDFKEIFGDKYCFDKVDFGGNSNTKVNVTCKNHGDFLIKLKDLSRGRGCVKCAAETNTFYSITSANKCKDTFINKPCVVYLLKLKGNQHRYKIGISTCFSDRLAALKRIHGDIEVIRTIDTNLYHAIYLEYNLLNLVRDYLIGGEHLAEVFVISNEGFFNLEPIFDEVRSIFHVENTA